MRCVTLPAYARLAVLAAMLFTLAAQVTLSNAAAFREERLGTLEFGLNDGLRNTEIFRYASRAPQGMAYVRHNGRESLFITVSASNASGPDKGQACRITQFAFRPDGSLDTRPVCFTKVLPIGHGQGMGAVMENGHLFFYCMSRYEDDPARRYKGVSRIRWRGADTGPEDVEEIPLLPNRGELAHYSFLTPNVSTDGRHLVTLCNVKGGGHACLIWKMQDVKPFARPARVFSIQDGIAKAQGWQGLCADSRRIYFVHGGISSLRRHAVAIYDYHGHMVRDFLIQDEKAAFGGEEGIKTWQQGVPWNIELEGIAIRGHDLLITGICTVSAAGDIVRWKGANYVCFKSTDGTKWPNNLRYWLPTSRKATVGEFKSGVAYRGGAQKEGSGRRYLNKYKYVYRLVGAAR